MVGLGLSGVEVRRGSVSALGGSGMGEGDGEGETAMATLFFTKLGLGFETAGSVQHRLKDSGNVFYFLTLFYYLNKRLSRQSAAKGS